MAGGRASFAGQQSALLPRSKQVITEKTRIDFLAIRPQVDSALAQTDRLTFSNNRHIPRGRLSRHD